MKKLLYVLSLLIIASMILAACGNGAAEEPVAEQPAAEEPAAADDGGLFGAEPAAGEQRREQRIAGQHPRQGLVAPELAAQAGERDAQRRLRARNALDLARAVYNRALGRALDAPVDLNEQLPGIDPNLDLDDEEMFFLQVVGEVQPS